MLVTWLQHSLQLSHSIQSECMVLVVLLTWHGWSTVDTWIASWQTAETGCLKRKCRLSRRKPKPNKQKHEQWRQQLEYSILGPQSTATGYRSAFSCLVSCPSEHMVCWISMYVCCRLSTYNSCMCHTYNIIRIWKSIHFHVVCLQLYSMCGYVSLTLTPQCLALHLPLPWTGGSAFVGG